MIVFLYTAPSLGLPRKYSRPGPPECYKRNSSLVLFVWLYLLGLCGEGAAWRAIYHLDDRMG